MIITLMPPFDHRELWAKARYWIDSTIHVDDYRWSGGNSWINGEHYPGSITFDKEEDALVFSLKFQELVKYIEQE